MRLAERAAAALFRVLRPGSVCVASVDGTWGGLDLYDPDRAQIPQYLGTLRSWEKFVEALEDRLQAGGTELHLSEAVERIETDSGSFTVHTRNSSWTADRVLAATPVPDRWHFQQLL